MDTLRICKQCQQPLPENSPEALCPACLANPAPAGPPPSPRPTININLQAEAASGGRIPPEVAELALEFPQLEVIELLGMGGMGMVYKARQPRLDRLVALKILPIDFQKHTSFAERFSREARALAKLNHSGIVDIYDFGQTSRHYYFVMEYVDGMNLRQLLESQTLEPRLALELITQICTALQYAHDEEVVHRDIKPENILITKKGQAKIADFGLAKLLGTAPDTALTMSQAMMGTLNYMAPEQRQNAQAVDHRADIYSLGVVFYEILTGELPLGRFEAPSSTPRGGRVDARLDEVVLRALERSPERRYQKASEVRTAVESIVGTQSGVTSAATSAAPKPEGLPGRDYSCLKIRYNLGRGWSLVTSDFWPTVAVSALVLILLQVAVGALERVGRLTGGLTMGFGVFQSLLTGPMIAGLSLYFLKKIRREPATVETAFAGFSKRYLHLFLANFVMSALIALGFVCLVLPGIYLIVAWIFALTLVIDRDLEFWPAMELSRKTVNQQWWKMLLFMISLLGVLVIGVLGCGFGLFIAFPVAIAAFMYAYEDIFGAGTPANPAAGSTVPPVRGGATPPPIARETSAAAKSSKLGLVLAIGLLLIALLVAGLLAVLEKQRSKISSSGIFSAISQVLAGRLPAAPPEPPEVLVPPPGGETGDYDSLVYRTRVELAKISVRFDQLQITNDGDTKLTLTFTGLRQRTQSKTNSAAPGGGLRTNADGGFTFALPKGIHLGEGTNSKPASISMPGLHVDVTDDQTDSAQTIDGTVVGNVLGDSTWRFAGSGKLTGVQFGVTNLVLEKVLGPVRATAVPSPPAPH